MIKERKRMEIIKFDLMKVKGKERKKLSLNNKKSG